MRIMIKGGVWKNTEDEILKAAVMKYGLNQWSRISSLLVRKSAKQCKARWYEWLDPSIKKTEWTREEDEKLLHLAKLLPTQWRTIAPIVGRTPAQCLDRYEKLLDMAVGKEDRYDASDDPRRLRPGEIDPNPEAKPARPDAVDMDEDEKEMLAEARARLANTRGKKAKRKAREKALEEARRLAALQKKRELKAAGIEVRGRDRRTRGIDYNAEVAFEHAPAPGFYDTAEEDERSRAARSEFRPVTVEELEGKRRRDIEEALIARDIKRQKALDEANPQRIVDRLNASAATMRPPRGRMMLPAPQVSEAELEAIARMGAGAGLDVDLADGAGGATTRQLLGDYQTPARFATPVRTPRTQAAGGQDALLAQAAQLAKLRDLQTPLVGGENPDLSNEDFGGVQPRASAAIAATPNPLAGVAATPGGRGPGATPAVGATPTPARTGSGAIAGVSATPLALAAATPGRGGGAAGGAATPMATPIRDQFGLNELDASALADARAGKAHARSIRNELRSGLSALPAPQNEYEVPVPELPTGEEEGGEGEGGPAWEEDAADAKARLRREAEARAALEELKKSKALQRGLPRPSSLAALPPPLPPSRLAGLGPREGAEALLAAEMGALLRSDAARHPPAPREEGGGGKRRSKGGAAVAAGADAPPLPEYSLEELAAAGELLGAEAEALRGAMGHAGVSGEEYDAAWEGAAGELLWLPSKRAHVRAAAASPAERVESSRAEHAALVDAMKAAARRAAKLDKKVNLVISGLEARAGKLAQAVDAAADGAAAARLELACFEALAAQEERAGPERLAAAAAAVAAQKERERELQERYKRLSRLRGDLVEELAAVGVVLA